MKKIYLPDYTFTTDGDTVHFLTWFKEEIIRFSITGSESYIEKRNSFYEYINTQTGVTFFSCV